MKTVDSVFCGLSRGDIVSGKEMLMLNFLDVKCSLMWAPEKKIQFYSSIVLRWRQKSQKPLQPRANKTKVKVKWKNMIVCNFNEPALKRKTLLWPYKYNHKKHTSIYLHHMHNDTEIIDFRLSLWKHNSGNSHSTWFMRILILSLHVQHRFSQQRVLFTIYRLN